MKPDIPDPKTVKKWRRAIKELMSSSTSQMDPILDGTNDKNLVLYIGEDKGSFLVFHANGLVCVGTYSGGDPCKNPECVFTEGKQIKFGSKIEALIELGTE